MRRTATHAIPPSIGGPALRRLVARRALLLAVPALALAGAGYGLFAGGGQGSPAAAGDAAPGGLVSEASSITVETPAQ
jgi:hypothetical protein